MQGKAADIFVRRQMATHPNHARILTTRAECLWAEGMEEEASKCAEEARSILVTSFEVDHPWIVDVERLLAQLSNHGSFHS